MLAQYLVDDIASNQRKTRFERLRYFAALKARRLLLRTSDPAVKFQVAGKTLHMPFSHDLPISSTYYPCYNTNLTRIARYVKGKYPDLTVIDIGANIGDTVAYIRQDTDAPVLCLEGNTTFFPFLKKNIEGTKNVDAELVFVGSNNTEFKASLHTERGTSRINPGAEAEDSVSTKTLSDIMQTHPQYAAAKLIKIDTDGFDLPILRGSLEFLRAHRPVLFFEYDPAYFLPLGDDGLSIFPELKAIGYETVLVYDNNGDFLVCTPLDASEVLEDIHRYFTGRNSARYGDLCIFAKEDADLAAEIRLKEHLFFEEQRGVKATPVRAKG